MDLDLSGSEKEVDDTYTLLMGSKPLHTKTITSIGHAINT